jgi:ribonuclease-3
MIEFLRRIAKKLSRKPKHPNSEYLPRLEQAISYQFKDPSILVQSLIHRSYSSEGPEELRNNSSNERLEFLGDAVLSLVVNEFLFSKYEDKREGELTKMKSVIVSKPILSHYSKRHNLGSFLLMSENAHKAKVDETDSVLADALEAVFGAVFLDGGFAAARGCVRRMLLAELNDIFYNEDNVNYKSLLPALQGRIHLGSRARQAVRGRGQRSGHHAR